jgi:hypothetical protein
MQFTSIEVRLATEADQHLPVFDNTKLTALDTCTRWGVITYSMHKKWPGSKKSKALDAGSALHEVFAAVRLWQLYYYDLPKDSPTSWVIADNTGKRLFGQQRWVDLALRDMLYLEGNTHEALQQFCLQVLHTSGYDADPDDKKRSMTNLEEVALNYCARWDMKKHPIWIRDIADPDTDVGIEIAYDLVITFKYYCDEHDDPVEQSYRFTGKLDGLHFDPTITNNDLTQGALYVVDNKTTSRIADDWGQAYELDTQLTGYMIASKVFTEQDVVHGKIIASSLPIPAKSTHGGQAIHNITREGYEFTRWFNWFYQLAQIEQQYKDNPIGAPVKPSSCIRYFKPCAMMPFCKASDKEQVQALTEMEDYTWDVLASEGSDE